MCNEYKANIKKYARIYPSVHHQPPQQNATAATLLHILKNQQYYILHRKCPSVFLYIGHQFCFRSEESTVYRHH